MRTICTLAALAGLAVVSTAQAGIAMSFADPIPGRQLHNVQNGAGLGVGQLSYDQNAVISLLIDGTDEGFGQVTFSNARMEMNLALGTAVTFGGVTQAPVIGTFTIYDMTAGRVDIVTGVASLGTYVRVGNTNSLLFSDPNFSYLPGPALSALMAPGRTFTSPTEGVFTLTSILADGGGSFINPDGSFRTFDANASFSGNTEVVPAPGVMALMGLGTLCMARRKRA
jgi:hypothetical protein